LTENPPQKEIETARIGEQEVPNGAGSVGGTAVYDAFLKEELASQDARKSSFEQRGLAVVTTAGALVTLLFGLAAIATRVGRGIPFEHEEKLWLVASLVLFVLSALSALATNFPLPGYESASTEGLRRRLTEEPANDAEGAHRDIALTQIDVLIAAKAKNKLKGRSLFGAMTFEVLAVACVGIAIFEVINP
jgi:hypothetical protein